MHEPVPPAQTSLDRRSVVLAMAVVASIANLLLNGMPLLVGTLASAYHLANDQLGLLATAYLLGNFLVVCSSLFWVRRSNWRRIIVFGAVGGFLLLGAVMAVPSVKSFLVCLFIFGGAMACCNAPVLAYWSDVTDPARAVSAGILCQVAGAAAFMYAVPTWWVPMMGVRGLVGFLMIALLPILLLTPWIPITGARRPDRDETEVRAFRQALLPIAGLCVMAIYFIGFIGVWAFLGQIGTAHGLSAQTASFALSVSLLVGAGASVVTWIVGDRCGYIKPLILSVGVYGLFLLMMSLAEYGPWFTAALISFNIAANVALPYQIGIIARSDRQGRYFVLLPAFQLAGAAAGPYLAGLMSHGSSYGGVYLMLVVVIVVSFVGYMSIAMRLGLVGPQRLKPTVDGRNDPCDCTAK